MTEATNGQPGQCTTAQRGGDTDDMDDTDDADDGMRHYPVRRRGTTTAPLSETE